MSPLRHYREPKHGIYQYEEIGVGCASAACVLTTAVIVQRPIDRTSAILHLEPAAKLIIEMNSGLCSE
jgi:hypothetical protein